MVVKLCAARGPDRVVVVTSDPETARQARRSGAWVFEELEQMGHSHSADAASRRAAELGARSVILLPIDVPLASVAEIEELAAEARRHNLLIVPSEDGTGTNALARTPPDLIPSCFGPGSFLTHLEQGRARGTAARVLRLPGLMFDVDTPEDLRELVRRAPQSRIAQLVEGRWAFTWQA
jgi:2-phospho-L-lactate guanylyltransferase